jgi:hypothetical protein
MIPVIVFEGALTPAYISIQVDRRFPVMIGLTLRRHWSIFKNNHNAMPMIIRVFVFTVFGIFSLG